MRSDRLKVLMPVRWPGGGIRTYIRYVYSQYHPEEFEFTLVGPSAGLAQLAMDLPMHNLRLVEVEPETNRRFFFKVMETIHRGKFDLVHSHGLTAGLAALVAARLGGLPHVLTGHDTFQGAQFAGPKGKLKHWLIGAALRGFTVIHFIGQEARSNWCGFFPGLLANPRRLVTIRSGIESTRFLLAAPEDLRGEVGVGSGVVLFGFLGRFMAQKGFADLIRAVSLLRDRGIGTDRFRVVCFGWGGFIREDQQVIRERGLASYFHFLAFRDDVSPTLKGLDVVLMPSRWEGLSLLAMECLVAGVPLIGTTCQGLQEILVGSPATVVAPEDPGALANAMMDSLVRDRREEFSKFAHEAAHRFDVACTARALAALYRQMAHAARA